MCFSFEGMLCRQKTYHQYKAERLNNHLLQDLTVPSLSHCVTRCLSNDQCVSFNWEDMTKQCQLNNAGKGGFPADVITTTSWNYYGNDGQV